MNLDHEKLILHHLLVNHQVISDVAEKLKPESFADPTLGAFYSIIVQASFKKTSPLTVDTLADTIASRPGSAERKKELIDSIISLAQYAGSTNADLDHSVETVARLWKRRMIVESLGRTIEHMHNQDEGVAEQELTVLLDRIGDIDSNRVFRTLAEAGDSAIRRYEDTAAGKGSPRSPTGFARIDATLGGYRRGELWVWGAYPSEGKTAIAKEFAYHKAVNGGRVLFISLEMSFEQMEMLFHVRHSNDPKFREIGPVLDTRLIERGKLEADQVAVYKAVAADFAKRDITIWAPGTVTLPEIRRRVSTMQAVRQLDLVVIDYLQLVMPERQRRDLRNEVTELMRGAKNLTQTENVPILALHQMSRKGREEAEQRGFYIMSDLSESAGVEQNADVVGWNLYTPEMARVNEIKIGVAKFRMGPKISEGYICYAGFNHSLLAERQPLIGSDYLTKFIT